MIDTTPKLMDPREWQRMSLPIDSLYEQLTILQERQMTAIEMDKQDMVTGIQQGIDRLNKIIEYRLRLLNEET